LQVDPLMLAASQNVDSSARSASAASADAARKDAPANASAGIKGFAFGMDKVGRRIMNRHLDDGASM